VNVKRSENFKLMTDINTVSLSGVLVADVEMSKAKGVSVARFFVDVESAGDQRAWGNFKVVAFAEWAEVAKKLSRGDKVVVVGRDGAKLQGAIPTNLATTARTWA
jgi:single-stranded DNA-binding protein